MTYAALPSEVRLLAERVLTEKQLDVLKLHLAGKSTREIARALNIAPSTAYDRVMRARQLMTLALEREKEAA